jgi:hypothetical protein
MKIFQPLNRREFLKTTATVAAGGALAAGLPAVLHAADAPPDWIADAARYQLPEWFDGHRAHLHTRLAFGNAEYMGSRVGEAFRSVGVRVFTRHVKSGDGGPFWPTKIGKPHPLAVKRNYAAEMIDDAHQSGCRMIGYYWHMAEKSVEDEHPDWLCRDPQGNPRKAGKQGNHLCLNSPYRDFVEKRLLELVDMKLDGFYFDAAHMPSNGCWCSFCRKKFREATGLEAPAKLNPDDPALPKLVEFNNATIEDAFRQWRQAIHARNPECVLIVSSSGYASLQSTHMSTRLFHLMDSNKTEFGHPYLHDRNLFTQPTDLRPPERDIRMAMGWSLCRDGCEGRPAHAWLPGMIDETECLFAAAGIVTHGCIANIDMDEKKIPDATLKKAYDLCERISPSLSGTKPLRWAAVHFSELGRRRHAIGDYFKKQMPEMWVHSTSRSFGAYRALFRDRLPVTLITDSQLEQGRTDDCSILFLPNPETLTGKMRAAIEAFQKRGGLLIEQRDAWEWHKEDGLAQATTELRGMIADRAKSSPVRVVGGPEKLHASAFLSADRRRLVVPVCNDFSWIDPHAKKGERITRKPDAIQAIEDATVILNLPGTHKKLYDAVTGKTLEARRTERGLEVKLPPFDILAVVVAELGEP